MELDAAIGFDAGKSMHHERFGSIGHRLVNEEITDTEGDLWTVFTAIAVQRQVLVVVDQLRSIGANPVAMAQATGIEVAYLEGLSMRRLEDLHPGKVKTDVPDAHNIAGAALAA